MTTPTPAGSSTAPIPMTTPSPLAILSNTTPRGSSIALSSLQALPETQLVLVLLDHPTIRRKWRAVVVPLVESISKKLNTAYSGSRLTIGCVVYRPTVDKSLLRPSWTLSRTKLQPGSKLIASNIHTPESWLGPELATASAHDADPTTASTYALIDGRTIAKPTAHVLEAFVAALELLQPTDNGIHNPLALKKPPVLARHLLHVCLDSSEVSLDLSSPPFFNADAANDRANAPAIGARLARLGVSISSCAVKADSPDATSTSEKALAAILGLHKSVSEPNKLANEDLAALLPEAIRSKIFSDANIISTGLTPGSAVKGGLNAASAGTPSGSTKRGREDEVEVSTPVKRSKSGSISQPQPSPLASTAGNSSAPPAGGAPSDIPRNIKLDPSISTKVLFLRSQQETMIKNWAAAYAVVSKAEAAGEPSPAKAPGMNKAYLEQLKAQLMTQQQALKMLVHRIISGVETAPNFNVSLQSLINIDKEAREMGVNLGGPGGGNAGMARPGRSGSLTGAQQPVVPQGMQAGANGGGIVPKPPATVAAPLQINPSAPSVPSAEAAIASTANSTISAPAAGGPPPSPTRPKPFWRGALTWSVISDPVTKQKRDVATLVSATSNSSALEKLLMPWPEKLQITAITQLAPRNLQVYAQSQNAPYILFSTQEAIDASSSSLGGGGPVLTAATAEKNRQMYSSLASSLDAKKSCAFIRHGSSAGAGLVLFATTQPTSSAERSAKGPVPPKLIGVVLKDTIPFSKLLAAQSGAQQQQGAGKAATPQARSRGASASGSLTDPNGGVGMVQSSQASTQVQPQLVQPTQPQPQPQPQPQQVQQPGMGLGSSMPFNLAALSAAGNVPVSGVGAGAGMSNIASAATGGMGGFGNLSNLGNLANFNLGALMAVQQQDAFNNGAVATSMGQQPNLAALAQLLGIGGQSGGIPQPPQQQQQQQQQQEAFSQAMPQLFNQIAAVGGGGGGAFAQQQQQQMFNNLNAFSVTSVAQQQQQQQRQVNAPDPGAGAGGIGLDFSKPMTMDQLRALGFIQ
ncbi:uncharacterized protein UTRI_02639 [Ustilago trichophora]|uniref:Uncharacterized protein n=1 Tax=Ustilago trichophora TaxID=86804 RepID=A0A5C3ENL4_9BASI|nr:uncharacterized protein UTRI_02639 [Ustilago trichophora]